MGGRGGGGRGGGGGERGKGSGGREAAIILETSMIESLASMMSQEGQPRLSKIHHELAFRHYNCH